MFSSFRLYHHKYTHEAQIISAHTSHALAGVLDLLLSSDSQWSRYVEKVCKHSKWIQPCADALRCLLFCLENPLPQCTPSVLQPQVRIGSKYEVS